MRPVQQRQCTHYYDYTAYQYRRRSNYAHDYGRRASFAVFPFEEIAAQEFILSEKLSDLRVAVENTFFLKNLKISIVWETASLSAMVNAVAEGLGIALIPLNYVGILQNNNIVVLNVAGFDIKRKINLVYLKQKRLPEASQRFIEFCRKRLQ